MIQRALLRPSRTIGSSLSRPSLPLSSSPRYASPLRRSIQQALIAKSYSSTSEVKTATVTDSGESAVDDQVAPAEAGDPQRKLLEARDREIIELKDKYLRSVAEFRNLQDRTKRELSAARDFAISRFAHDLVDSIDNLDRALSTVPLERLGQDDSNKDLENLHSGLKMTERILMQTLAKHGLERFDPSEKGEMFDPNLHEATFMTKMEDMEDGTAFNTQQKGFKLNGRVIRAAKVGVVKNS